MITVRPFEKRDASAAGQLVVAVYAQFNRQEATEAGYQHLVAQFDPAQLSAERLYAAFNRPIALVACDGDRIVGVLRGKPDRLGGLFVDGAYHHQGVARELVHTYFARAKALGGNVVKVRSSLYAVPFYRRMGFKPTTGIRQVHGLRMVNMKKVL